MPFKNIAKYGYQQTLAGTWDLGGGVRMTFGISDPRAERFTITTFGPTTQRMKDNQRAQAIAGISLEGPSTTDTGAELRPQMTGRGAGLIALANILLAAQNFQTKSYVQIHRTAFALGAPVYHGGAAELERKRDKLEAALKDRGTRGLGDLSWVARHYMGVIDQGPYFAEDGGRRWWESGFIAVPQSVPDGCPVASAHGPAGQDSLLANLPDPEPSGDWRSLGRLPARRRHHLQPRRREDDRSLGVISPPSGDESETHSPRPEQKRPRSGTLSPISGAAN